MRRRARFYVSVLAVTVALLAAVAIAPEQSLIVLTLFVPAMIAAAIVSVIYLARVYQAQPTPRSRFFGMLLEMFYALIAVGLWVGYLSVARLVERADLGWVIPAPGPAHSAPISAIVVITVFAWPVRMALEVWRVRRRSEDPREPFDTDELDRSAR